LSSIAGPRPKRQCSERSGSMRKNKNTTNIVGIVV
jgi:hypothetical protein